MGDKNAVANKVQPDLVDVFIILLLATALNIFLFTVATQFIHDPVFQSLPSFLTDTYSAIWTSMATGAAGIGLVAIKSLGRRREGHPNYLVYVLLTAGAFLLAIFIISFSAYRLAPVSVLSVPPDVALITGRNMAQR